MARQCRALISRKWQRMPEAIRCNGRTWLIIRACSAWKPQHDSSTVTRVCLLVTILPIEEIVTDSLVLFSKLGSFLCWAPLLIVTSQHFYNNNDNDGDFTVC